MPTMQQRLQQLAILGDIEESISQAQAAARVFQLSQVPLDQTRPDVTKITLNQIQKDGLISTFDTGVATVVSLAATLPR